MTGREAGRMEELTGVVDSVVFDSGDGRFSVFRLCGAVMTACGDTWPDPPRQVTQTMLEKVLPGKNHG